MTERTYGQFCGIAHALELVGERWALLVVRDLLIGPKRFTDLRRGLPRIPSNVLSARLKELEQAGIVRRRVLPRPAAAVVYELTPYGQDLEDVVLRLGRWGARSMSRPRPEDIVTADALMLALMATFQSEAARGQRCTFELRVTDVVIHARIDDGVLRVADGPLPDADAIIEPGLMLKALMAGDVTPAEALASDAVRVEGDQRVLAQFAALFRLEPTPMSVG